MTPMSFEQNIDERFSVVNEFCKKLQNLEKITEKHVDELSKNNLYLSLIFEI